MIGLGTATAGSAQAFDYLLKEEKDVEILDCNLISGNTGLEMLNDIRVLQNLNSKCYMNTFSFVISAETTDANSLTKKELVEIKNDFLLDVSAQMNKHNSGKGKKSNFNLLNHQHLAVLHQNTKTSHIHILCSRIDNEGKAAPDHHIAFKCQHAAHRVGESRGFVNAWDRKNEKSNLLAERLRLERQRIYKIYQDVLKLKPKNFKEYALLMEKKGIHIEPSINKKGLMQGYRVLDKSNGINLKTSEVHKKMTLKHLVPIFSITIQPQNKKI